MTMIARHRLLFGAAAAITAAASVVASAPPTGTPKLRYTKGATGEHEQPSARLDPEHGMGRR